MPCGEKGFQCRCEETGAALRDSAGAVKLMDSVRGSARDGRVSARSQPGHLMPNAEGARSEQPVVHSSEQVAANTKEILVLAPVVELETQSAAGKPNYLAVEQRSDEFAAKLLGLDGPPALPSGRGATGPRSGRRPASASSATSRQTRWSVPRRASAHGMVASADPGWVATGTRLRDRLGGRGRGHP